MKYMHLSQEERDALSVLLQDGMTKAEIARRLGRPRSTIGREIERNSTCVHKRYHNAKEKRTAYLPDRAQVKYRQRITESKYRFPLKNTWTYQYVLKHLKGGWSPEQISGRIRLDLEESISHECIYQFIYSKRGRKLELSRYLRRSQKQRRKRHGRKHRHGSCIPNRTDIACRPESVAEREDYGHWETDSIVGKGRSALNTTVERKSRFLLLRKVLDKRSATTAAAMTDGLEEFPERLRQSVTADNGPEFAAHELLTQALGIDVYFAKPYHPWERGTNENTNGLIRRYFPKRTDFDGISEAEIRHVQDLLNDRPRKCLDFKKPKETFLEALSTCCT